jgi:hypothetical protein
MDNPFTWFASLPDALKADIERMVSNAKIQAQISVLEIEAELNQRAGELIASRITSLKAQLQ